MDLPQAPAASAAGRRFSAAATDTAQTGNAAAGSVAISCLRRKTGRHGTLPVKALREGQFQADAPPCTGHSISTFKISSLQKLFLEYSAFTSRRKYSGLPFTLRSLCRFACLQNFGQAYKNCGLSKPDIKLAVSGFHGNFRGGQAPDRAIRRREKAAPGNSTGGRQQRPGAPLPDSSVPHWM